MLCFITVLRSDSHESDRSSFFAEVSVGIVR